MITKPMSVYPNNNTIDGTIDNTFQMEIKTSGDTVVYYQIQILNATTGASLFTGTKTATTKYNGDFLNIPVAAGSFSNDLDLNWKATLWSPNSNMLVVNGLVQSGSSSSVVKIRQHSNVEANMILKIEGESRTITNYDYNTGNATVSPAFPGAPSAGMSYTILTDFIHTPLYFFKARTTPVVSFTAIDNPITSRAYTFNASYTQAEGTNIKYFIFNLYDNANEIIDTTNQVYSSNLTYSFDGFLSGDYSTLTPRSYKLELIINNQDDVEISEELNINILYPAPSIDARPYVEFLEEKGGAQIGWAKNMQAIGAVIGDYSFVADTPVTGQTALLLPDGSVLTYDEINNDPLVITEDSTLVLETSLGLDRQGKIVGMIIDDVNEVHISIDGYNFVLTDKNGNTLVLADIISMLNGETEQNYSCFQDYSDPIENTGYILYNDEIWDTSKYLLITFFTTLLIRYRIVLRTMSGDVEILSTEYYTLIKSSLDFLEGATIIDCGINISQLETTTFTLIESPDPSDISG